MRYSNEMSVLPFLFFLPYIEDSDNKASIRQAYFDFKRYASDGKEIPVRPVAIVSEHNKRGNEITRCLNEDEKRLLNNSLFYIYTK